MGRHAQHVAEALAVYLTDGDGDTPQERGRRQAKLCESVSWLLQDLMVGQPGWDSRYTWLDGIAAPVISRIEPDALHLVGGAYVVNGKKWTLRPVQAELKQPPAGSSLYFASPEAEVNFVPGREDRLVIPPDPSKWPHVFEVVLQ